MRLLFGFLIITLFYSCGPKSYFDCSDTRVIYQIIRNQNKKLATIGLYEFSNGGAGYDKVKEISEGYITNGYRFRTIGEARAFFCDLFEAYVKPFNEHESIHSLMAEFPITAENMRLSVTFLDEKGNSLPEPFISYITTNHGNIRYYVWNENHVSALVHTETYEEAKKIIESKSAS